MTVERAQLSVTLLSPLHIGCGHDYAPYEYLDLDDQIAVFGPEQLLAVIPVTDRYKLAQAASDPVRPVERVRDFVWSYKNALLARIFHQPYDLGA